MADCLECKKKLEIIKRKTEINKAKEEKIRLFRQIYSQVDPAKLVNRSKNLKDKAVQCFFEESNKSNDGLFLFQTTQNKKYAEEIDHLRSTVKELESKLPLTEKTLKHVNFVNKQLVSYHNQTEESLKSFKKKLRFLANSVLKSGGKNAKAKACLKFIDDFGNRPIVKHLKEISATSEEPVVKKICKDLLKDCFNSPTSSTASSSGIGTDISDIPSVSSEASNCSIKEFQRDKKTTFDSKTSSKIRLPPLSCQSSQVDSVIDSDEDIDQIPIPPVQQSNSSNQHLPTVSSSLNEETLTEISSKGNSFEKDILESFLAEQSTLNIEYPDENLKHQDFELGNYSLDTNLSNLDCSIFNNYSNLPDLENYLSCHSTPVENDISIEDKSPGQDSLKQNVLKEDELKRDQSCADSDSRFIPPRSESCGIVPRNSTDSNVNQLSDQNNLSNEDKNIDTLLVQPTLSPAELVEFNETSVQKGLELVNQPLVNSIFNPIIEDSVTKSGSHSEDTSHPVIDESFLSNSEDRSKNSISKEVEDIEFNSTENKEFMCNNSSCPTPITFNNTSQEIQDEPTSPNSNEIMNIDSKELQEDTASKEKQNKIFDENNVSPDQSNTERIVQKTLFNSRPMESIRHPDQNSVGSNFNDYSLPKSNISDTESSCLSEQATLHVNTKDYNSSIENSLNIQHETDTEVDVNISIIQSVPEMLSPIKSVQRVDAASDTEVAEVDEASNHENNRENVESPNTLPEDHVFGVFHCKKVKRSILKKPSLYNINENSDQNKRTQTIQTDRNIEKGCRLGVKKTSDLINYDKYVTPIFVDCIENRNKQASGILTPCINPRSNAYVQGSFWKNNYPHNIKSEVNSPNESFASDKNKRISPDFRNWSEDFPSSYHDYYENYEAPIAKNYPLNYDSTSFQHQHVFSCRKNILEKQSNKYDILWKTWRHKSEDILSQQNFKQEKGLPSEPIFSQLPPRFADIGAAVKKFESMSIQDQNCFQEFFLFSNTIKEYNYRLNESNALPNQSTIFSTKTGSFFKNIFNNSPSRTNPNESVVPDMNGPRTSFNLDSNCFKFGGKSFFSHPEKSKFPDSESFINSVDNNNDSLKLNKTFESENTKKLSLNINHGSILTGTNEGINNEAHLVSTKEKQTHESSISSKNSAPLSSCNTSNVFSKSHNVGQSVSNFSLENSNIVEKTDKNLNIRSSKEGKIVQNNKDKSINQDIFLNKKHLARNLTTANRANSSNQIRSKLEANEKSDSSKNSSKNSLPSLNKINTSSETENKKEIIHKDEINCSESSRSKQEEIKNVLSDSPPTKKQKISNLSNTLPENEKSDENKFVRSDCPKNIRIDNKFVVSEPAARNVKKTFKLPSSTKRVIIDPINANDFTIENSDSVRRKEETSLRSSNPIELNKPEISESERSYNSENKYTKENIHETLKFKKTNSGDINLLPDKNGVFPVSGKSEDENINQENKSPKQETVTSRKKSIQPVPSPKINGTPIKKLNSEEWFRGFPDVGPTATTCKNESGFEKVNGNINSEANENSSIEISKEISHIQEDSPSSFIHTEETLNNESCFNKTPSKSIQTPMKSKNSYEVDKEIAEINKHSKIPLDNNDFPTPVLSKKRISHFNKPNKSPITCQQLITTDSNSESNSISSLENSKSLEKKSNESPLKRKYEKIESKEIDVTEANPFKQPKLQIPKRKKKVKVGASRSSNEEELLENIFKEMECIAMLSPLPISPEQENNTERKLKNIPEKKVTINEGPIKNTNKQKLEIETNEVISTTYKDEVENYSDPFKSDIVKEGKNIEDSEEHELPAITDATNESSVTGDMCSKDLPSESDTVASNIMDGIDESSNQVDNPLQQVKHQDQKSLNEEKSKQNSTVGLDSYSKTNECSLKSIETSSFLAGENVELEGALPLKTDLTGEQFTDKKVTDKKTNTLGKPKTYPRKNRLTLVNKPNIAADKFETTNSESQDKTIDLASESEIDITISNIVVEKEIENISYTRSFLDDTAKALFKLNSMDNGIYNEDSPEVKNTNLDQAHDQNLSADKPKISQNVQDYTKSLYDALGSRKNNYVSSFNYLTNQHALVHQDETKSTELTNAENYNKTNIFEDCSDNDTAKALFELNSMDNGIYNEDSPEVKNTNSDQAHNQNLSADKPKISQNVQDYTKSLYDALGSRKYNYVSSFNYLTNQHALVHQDEANSTELTNAENYNIFEDCSDNDTCNESHSDQLVDTEDRNNSNIVKCEEKVSYLSNYYALDIKGFYKDLSDNTESMVTKKEEEDKIISDIVICEEKASCLSNDSAPVITSFYEDLSDNAESSVTKNKEEDAVMTEQTHEIPNENEEIKKNDDENSIQVNLEYIKPFLPICNPESFNQNSLNADIIDCSRNLFHSTIRYIESQVISGNEKFVPRETEKEKEVQHSMKTYIQKEMYRIINSDCIFVVAKKVVKSLKTDKKMEISPNTFARAVCDTVKADKGQVPEEKPAMGKNTLSCCIFTMLYVGKLPNDFLLGVLRVIEEVLGSYHDKTLTVTDGVRIASYYTAVCQAYSLDMRVKNLIIDLIYSRYMKSCGIIFKILQIWPELLLYRSSTVQRDCLLTQTIISLLISSNKDMRAANKNNASSIQRTYCSKNLKEYLRSYYGYHCGNFTSNYKELIEKCIMRISSEDARKALILMCRCVGLESAILVVTNQMFPILDGWIQGKVPPSTALDILVTAALIIRGMPLVRPLVFVNKALLLFEKILHHSPDAMFLERVVESIFYLRRHNIFLCFYIIINYTPPFRNMTKNTVRYIRGIISTANIKQWLKTYQKFHNKQTYKSLN